MKWGRKKSAGISLPHLFPIQWLSKLKQISIKPKSQPTPKSKPKTKPKSSPYNSSIPVCFRSSRPSDSGFRSVSDLSFSPQIFDRKTGQNLTGFVEPEDHFWRFSFRRQTHEFSEDGESSEDEFEFPMPKYSGSISSRSSIKIERDKSDYRFSQSQKFGDMLTDIRKKRSDIFWKFERLAEEQGSEDPRRSKKIEKSKKSRRAAARILEKEEVLTSREESGQEEGRSPTRSSQISKSDQTDESISLDSRKSSQKKEDEEVQKSTALLSRKPGEGIGEDDDRPLSDTSEQKSEKDKKIKNLKRRTAKIRPRSQDGVYSPKRVSRNETCKIRSLERAKKRKKKKRETEKCRSFEKFAVVTSSFDPQNDFRESMMEMIAENGIEQPEELKSLLFCYLSLNSEEYHSLIIKVFRQVWFDLNRASLRRQSMETIASNIIRV